MKQVHTFCALDLFLFICKMRKTLFYLPLILLFVACRHESLPTNVLPQERMVDFLTEAYLLEGYYAIESQYRYDIVSSEVLQRYDSILDAQGLTREEVERSINYYLQHVDAYQAIHDSVLVRLEAQSESEKE